MHAAKQRWLQTHSKPLRQEMTTKVQKQTRPTIAVRGTVSNQIPEPKK
jgi:hypothetical protein